MRYDDPELEAILGKWRAALRSPTPLWEGPRAVAELQRAGANIDHSSTEQALHTSMLGFVRCERIHRWRPREMLANIFSEVEDYKRQKTAWRKEFRDTELFLAGLVRRVSRQRASDPRLKRLLQNTATAVERRRLVLRNFMNPARRSPLGVWEGVWSKHARAENIRREIDRDTRLQKQAAKMFRTFLHEDEGVSLRTIARLVVLVYQVGGIASYDKKAGHLMIANSQRAITVRSVEEKLRRWNIHGIDPT
jgi:hypothetical protein